MIMSSNGKGVRQVPTDWKVVKLGLLADKVGSGITPRGGRKTYRTEGVPLIRSQNVLVGQLSLDDVAYISQEQHEKMAGTQLRPRDVLLNITGASIGRSCIVPEELSEGNVNQHVCIIRPIRDRLDPYYLSSLLNSHYGQKQIYVFQAGGNRQGLNYEQIRAFLIPVPPLSEQRKIAAVLRSWDETIRLTENLILAKENRKKGLMKKLLMGEVRSPGSSGKPWKKFRMTDIFTRVTRKNTSGNANVLTASAQHGLISQVEFFNRGVAGKDLSRYYLLRRGEFAYNRSSASGYPYGAIKRLDAYEEGVLSTLYICFCLKDDAHDSDYLTHYFEAGGLDREIYSIAAEGARSHGLLNIGVKDFFSLRLELPVREDQLRIADFLNACDQEIELLQLKLSALHKQRRGLAQRLITGQIRVRVQT